METLKKIVSNQYFPAAAVLTAVVLFWAVGLLGGLSLLNNNQPPLTTLTWMLFVYLAAVLTPLAGILAAVDLVRRWKRNRAAETAAAAGGSPGSGSGIHGRRSRRPRAGAHPGTAGPGTGGQPAAARTAEAPGTAAEADPEKVRPQEGCLSRAYRASSTLFRPAALAAYKAASASPTSVSASTRCPALNEAMPALSRN
jgi:hypothetical protein